MSTTPISLLAAFVVSTAFSPSLAKSPVELDGESFPTKALIKYQFTCDSHPYAITLARNPVNSHMLMQSLSISGNQVSHKDLSEINRHLALMQSFDGLTMRCSKANFNILVGGSNSQQVKRGFSAQFSGNQLLRVVE